jgi:hypothetical protein
MNSEDIIEWEGLVRAIVICRVQIAESVITMVCSYELQAFNKSNIQSEPQV